MEEPKMYAKCIYDTGVMFSLDKGQEYRVIGVENINGFADVFYRLENGLLYASCHFGGTYLK